MRKLFLILLLGIFMFGLVSAIDDHQQNIDYDYSKNVANADNCNITSIRYPRGTSSNLNLPMTKTGFNFNATITKGNFTILGLTCFDINCYDADATPNYADGEKCLIISPTGNTADTSQIGLYGLMLIVMFFFFGITIYGAFKIPYKNVRNSDDEVLKINWKKYLKVFSGMMAYFFLLAINWTIWNLTYAYAQWHGVSNVFFYLYRLMYVFILPTILGLILLGLANLVNDAKINAFIKRMGVPYKPL